MKKLRQIIQEEVSKVLNEGELNEYYKDDLVNAPQELTDMVEKLTGMWKKYQLSIGADYGRYAIGLPANGLNFKELQFILKINPKATIFYKDMLPAPTTSKKRRGLPGGLWMSTGIDIPRETTEVY